MNVDLAAAAASARSRSRSEQGLPPVVEDLAAIEAVAAIVRPHPSRAPERRAEDAA